MKKALLILVSLMLVVSLAACAPADNGDDAVVPEVKATATADDAGKTAADLLAAAMQESNIDYDFANGIYDNVGGFANGEENSWFFYYNDALSTVGAADVTLAEGDVVELRYESTATIDNLPLDDNTNADDEDVNTPVDGEDANAPVDGEDANAPVDGEDANANGEDTNADGETTPAE